MNDFNIVDRTILFCAKRNSGKTQLMKHILKLYKDQFKAVFLVSPTEQITHTFRDLIKPENMFDEYSEEWTKKLMDKLAKINEDKNGIEKSHVLLILDDIAADTNLHSSKTFKQLFVKGRHYGITIFVTSQYINLISPIARTNSDWIFAGQMNRNALDILAQEYLSGDIDKKDFIGMYNKNTQDYGFLLINANSIKDNSNLDEIYGHVKINI